jgi:excinuclease ABC subunit A
MARSWIEQIEVRDARTHNLRGVDVDIPHHAIVAFTGVSGSGKSSLAFDTIFAEAQRRYFESVAPYARRLVQQASTPRVGSINGLPPAVALQQRRSLPGARSSMGTITTTSNVLRMLISRAGSYPEGMTRLDSDAFSPNTAAGACPVCHGVGTRYELTEQSLVHDPSLSIRDRAVSAWPGAWQGKNQRDILAVLGYDIDAPWSTLPQHERDWILFTDEQPVVMVDPVREVGRTQRPYKGQFMSAQRYVMKALTMSQSAQQRRRALEFVNTLPCEACHGTRLTPDALRVTFAGRNIVELSALSVRELIDVMQPFADHERIDEDPDAALSVELLSRLETIDGLGLGYLSLDRAATTLSPGELQRLRIATQLRSGLFGVVYVLDEVSAGLHPADSEALVELLLELRDAGNTILLVEHDLGLVATADWVVDIGPQAGERGGRLLYAGPVSGLAGVDDSVTGRYIAAPAPASRTPRAPSGHLSFSDIVCNNLQGVDVALPLNALTVVTGVSGSGKSSLISTVVARSMAAHLEVAATDDDTDPDVTSAATTREYSVGSITGADPLARLVQVDQRPIGRSPRSNLATYTGLFDGVRKLFAATDAAKERGFNAGRFSFNVDGGRCETCRGEGFVAVELMFLPGTYRSCETCDGSRYAPEALEVRWDGLTIADVLALTVEAALEVFADQPSISKSLRALDDVGLGYLRLGQPATELSGGEAQRIKLATELQRSRRGHALYLFDEPTTGLHAADVERLIEQFQRLVDDGHTVIVVEHDMSVVAAADHVIDMGPGAGADGGTIVASGTPADVAASDVSRTAPYLRDAL